MNILEHLYPQLFNPEHTNLKPIIDSKPQKPRDVLGSSYPSGLYIPILEYWSNACAYQEEYEENNMEKGTTWIELTIDFIATTGIIPCSLDYGATNLESACLSFKTISQRIFKKHGTRIQTNIRSNRRLEPIGLDKNTGISANMQLINQPYLLSLIHI